MISSLKIAFGHKGSEGKRFRIWGTSQKKANVKFKMLWCQQTRKQESFRVSYAGSPIRAENILMKDVAKIKNWTSLEAFKTDGKTSASNESTADLFTLGGERKGRASCVPRG